VNPQLASMGITKVDELDLTNSLASSGVNKSSKRQDRELETHQKVYKAIQEQVIQKEMG